MSYARKEKNYTIFDLLHRDHETHRSLLQKIENNRDAEEVKMLFQHFAVEFTAHAVAEEQALYSNFLQNPRLTNLMRHSIDEHKKLEDLIDLLSYLTPLSEGWRMAFRQFKYKYLHHINEEEIEIFPAAEHILSLTEKNKMGEIFELRKLIEKNAF